MLYSHSWKLASSIIPGLILGYVFFSCFVSIINIWCYAVRFWFQDCSYNFMMSMNIICIFCYIFAKQNFLSSEMEIHEWWLKEFSANYNIGCKIKSGWQKWTGPSQWVDSDSPTTECRILENKVPISLIARKSYEDHYSHVIWFHWHGNLLFSKVSNTINKCFCQAFCTYTEVLASPARRWFWFGSCGRFCFVLFCI